jgi:hypothetical protein
VQLSGVISWGRSFDEYRRMFRLTPTDLQGSVLGCGDGPASFNASATALGYRVISCDPLYALSVAEINGRVAKCYDTVITQLREQLDGFIWTYFRDPDQLDFDFHTAAFAELLRVAHEVRVFPLLNLQRRWSPHVDSICEHLKRLGLQVDVTAVDYEFAKAENHAGNRMLRVSRKAGRP